MGDAEVGHKLSSAELQARYKESSRFTSGKVFGKGNGVLNAAVRDEVINRRRAREAKEAEAVSNSKKKFRNLQSQVKNVRKGMRKQGEKFKHTINSLKPLVRWKMASSAYKKEKKDAIPTKKADLLDKYEKIKNLPSPQVSPWNSENEDESNQFIMVFHSRHLR